MEKLFKKILVLAVMFGTYTSFAFEGLKSTSTFSSVISKGDLISVSDNSGKTIYSGRANYQGNVQSLYDFSKLKDGLYFIEVDKDFKIETNTIEVKNHVVSYFYNSEKTFFKPMLRTEGAKVYISKLALESENMEIELYYKDELIHAENIVGNSILKRVYKLDETVKGEYSAIIRINDRVYIENFEF